MLERQKNVAAFYSKQANGLSNRSSQTLCRWFACEPILHHGETLCVFILLGAFWAKEHITSSLCFIVFSKLINGKHSGKNRYENVYFALLKSLSTKGYQQLLWHNLWNVIRVCVWESSADKAASAITDSPLITFRFAPSKLILSELILHDICIYASAITGLPVNQSGFVVREISRLHFGQAGCQIYCDLFIRVRENPPH